MSSRHAPVAPAIGASVFTQVVPLPIMLNLCLYKVFAHTASVVSVAVPINGSTWISHKLEELLYCEHLLYYIGHSIKYYSFGIKHICLSAF